jgi:hypothetical protein
VVQSESTVQVVLQADAEAQINEFLQALVAATQLCVVSHALVVIVDPEHESMAQDVPLAG